MHELSISRSYILIPMFTTKPDQTYTPTEATSLSFPPAVLDPRLVTLQDQTAAFVTRVIIQHETEIYAFLGQQFPDKKVELLGTTNDTIYRFISVFTHKFYNRLYKAIQNGTHAPYLEDFIELIPNADYEPHILLDRLIRLTLDIHAEISRERLASEADCDAYIKTVLNQINLYLPSLNLIDYLMATEQDQGPFVPVPEGEDAFKVSIDITKEKSTNTSPEPEQPAACDHGCSCAH